MTPEEPRPSPLVVPPPVYRWYQKTGALVFAIFCVDLGLFLAVYPWTAHWHTSLFAAIPSVRPLWFHIYLRGGISLLGGLNLFIGIGEFARLRRIFRR
jgi:hypothetical protein